MTDGRVNVLRAVDRQLRLGTLPPAGSLEHPGELALPAADVSSALALADRFAVELEALGGVTVRAAGDDDAVVRVRAILSERRATRVLSWDAEWLNCAGLANALTAAGVALESCWLPPDAEPRRLRLAELDPVTVGLTGTLAGLADTGSLVLVSGPGRGRMASLLPPVHVAVLRADQIYPTYAAFLAAHPDIVEEGSNLVLVTGPSRTADIEMTLTRGVHGPGEVITVLIEGAIER
jgi:L-lactate dehydrogenase complex protein LldG